MRETLEELFLYPPILFRANLSLSRNDQMTDSLGKVPCVDGEPSPLCLNSCIIISDCASDNIYRVFRLLGGIFSTKNVCKLTFY